MLRVNIVNGFVYIYGLDEELDWCDVEEKDNGTIVNYFLLNVVTKQLFKEKFLPLIRSGQVIISQHDYDTIRTFKQNQDNGYIAQPDDAIKNKLFPGIELMDHQVSALKLMITHDQYGFFYGPGTGKTLIAIGWLKIRKPETCLIVTPQKVIGQYQAELEKYIPGNKYEVTNFEQLHKFVEIKRSEKKRSSKTTLLKRFDALIVDESHRAKNYSSEINIRLRAIAEHATYKFIFTGSPQDKSRDDILSQLAILDKRVMPTKTKTISRYFRLDDYFNPKHEIRERKKELTEVIKCYTLARKTEDVITLTEANDFIIKCEHPHLYYDKLVEDRAILFGENEQCIADTPTNLRIELKEICCGILKIVSYDEEGVEHERWIEFETPKEEALKQTLAIIPKGIIYYEFTNSVKNITGVIELLNKKYVVVNGMTSAKSSKKSIDQFKNGDVDYLIIQSKSGNAGLDLTNVNDIIFYSLPDSFIVFEQCKHRIRRIGQEKECNYYYLICRDTIEENNFKILQQKKNFNDRVFRQLFKEN